MKKKIALCFLIILLSFQGFTQNDSIRKTNPIIFADMNIGMARLDGEVAMNLTYRFNYQRNKNLYSLRYSGTAVLNTQYFFIVPLPTLETYNEEIGFLYGKRWIDDGQSTSISLGVSYNRFRAERDEITDVFNIQSNHIGLPFEANIKWFKSRKKRVRIYGLLPVGRPTGLGGSFGFKLSGNISKKSYVSLGLTYSFGYHRTY
jgi:hypothetical protein